VVDGNQLHAAFIKSLHRCESAAAGPHLPTDKDVPCTSTTNVKVYSNLLPSRFPPTRLKKLTLASFSQVRTQEVKYAAVHTVLEPRVEAYRHVNPKTLIVPRTTSARLQTRQVYRPLHMARLHATPHALYLLQGVDMLVTRIDCTEYYTQPTTPHTDCHLEEQKNFRSDAPAWRSVLKSRRSKMPMRWTSRIEKQDVPISLVSQSCATYSWSDPSLYAEAEVGLACIKPWDVDTYNPT
jgi:hypothetical protein